MFGFTIMWHDIPQLHVKVIQQNGIHVETKQCCAERHMRIPVILWENRGKIKDVLKFLETRTVPRTRYDLDDILKRYGLRDYDPVAMVRKSHGVSMSDYVWILFDDEPRISYDSIRIRPKGS